MSPTEVPVASFETTSMIYVWVSYIQYCTNNLFYGGMYVSLSVLNSLTRDILKPVVTVNFMLTQP